MQSRLHRPPTRGGRKHNKRSVTWRLRLKTCDQNTEENFEKLSGMIARKIFRHLSHKGCDGCDYKKMGCSLDKLLDISDSPVDEEADKFLFCAAQRDLIMAELHTYAAE